MHVVMWGTYDLGKPRARILRAALAAAGVEVTEIHADVWGGVEDKSQVKSAGRKVLLLLRWLASYPGLIVRYLKAPKHDAILVGYLGQLDVLLLWPFARLRGQPVVWDMFISLYDTVVHDRQMIGPRHPLAWLLWLWEWLACRAADLVLMDTGAHAQRVRELFALRDAGRVTPVFVGAELGNFKRAPDGAPKAYGEPTTVLFYGQFIPLHGISTIVHAMDRARHQPIRWVIVGQGQEAEKVRGLIETLELGPETLCWIPWVPYDELPARIAAADVCLGIFGRSEKAASVIPNKAFQILAVGRPLITRDSPAIRELLEPGSPGIKLIEPEDPDALIEAVKALGAEGFPRPAVEVQGLFTTEAIGQTLKEKVANLRTAR